MVKQKQQITLIRGACILFTVYAVFNCICYIKHLYVTAGSPDNRPCNKLIPAERFGLQRIFSYKHLLLFLINLIKINIYLCRVLHTLTTI